MNILLISGSQRTGSFNTRLIQEIPALAPEHSFTELDYSALPLFSQDLENPFPQEAQDAKDSISKADAIIISTPEHNRTIPAALTNLISWTSRPYSQGAWVGKAVYVTGASPGNTGTALAQADVRKSLLFLEARVMGQPENYISGIKSKFTDDGLADEATKESLQKAIAALAEFAQQS